MKDTINADLKSAMKSSDKVRLETVRSIKMAVTNYEKSNPGKDLDIDKILRTMENQRKMSIDAYELAGETDRESAERAELFVIQEYIDKFLPKRMDEKQIRVALEEIIVHTSDGNSNKVIGKTMGEFSKKYKGLADMNLAAQILKEVLG